MLFNEVRTERVESGGVFVGEGGSKIVEYGRVVVDEGGAEDVGRSGGFDREGSAESFESFSVLLERRRRISGLIGRGKKKVGRTCLTESSSVARPSFIATSAACCSSTNDLRIVLSSSLTLSKSPAAA